MTTQTAAEYWENRYRENGRSWSGNVNVALEREVAAVEPGTALDLGSGEGGDALWLARQGWSVTAVDIAPSALAIAQTAQLPHDDITWIAADLAEWQPPRSYDLVSACFLHSFVELPREAILRRAATAVAPGGLLVIVGHSGAPHWHDPSGHEAVHLPTPDEVLASLALDDGWTVVTKALIERQATAPDGSTGVITDGVLTLRRER
jgi:SAM-dependent methyltransferase